MSCEEAARLSEDACHLLRHAKDCQERCKKLERCMDDMQDCDSEYLFPITVSRRPAGIGCSKEKQSNGSW